MTDKVETKLIVRKVRGKDEFCVKLNGKELCKFNNKLDALNYKHEFLGNNNENLHLEEKEEKPKEEKPKEEPQVDCVDGSCVVPKKKKVVALKGKAVVAKAKKAVAKKSNV